jgi:hypothetical protein
MRHPPGLLPVPDRLAESLHQLQTAQEGEAMIKDLLESWCAHLFLFFFNCWSQLNTDNAVAAIESMVDQMRAYRNTEAIQTNYRKALESK